MPGKGSRASGKTQRKQAVSQHKRNGEAKAKEAKILREKAQVELAERRLQATAEAKAEAEEMELAQVLESIRKMEADTHEIANGIIHLILNNRIDQADAEAEAEADAEADEMRGIAKGIIHLIMNNGIGQVKNSIVKFRSVSILPIEITDASKIIKLYRYVEDNLDPQFDAQFIKCYDTHYLMQFYVSEQLYIVKFTIYPFEYSADDDMYDVYSDDPNANVKKNFYKIEMKVFN